MDPSLTNFLGAVADEPSLTGVADSVVGKLLGHSSINNNSVTTDPTLIDVADSVVRNLLGQSSIHNNFATTLPSPIHVPDTVTEKPLSQSSINNNSATTDQSRKNHRKTISQELRDAVEQIKFNSSFTICRVPQELRKLKKNAYTPSLVSIGPLHSKDEHLKPLGQNIKLSYANTFFYEVAPQTQDNAWDMLNNCLTAMKKSIKKAKGYYAEEVPTLSEEMLVIDGCFILQLLYSYYLAKKDDEKNPHADSSGSRNQECNDPIGSVPQRCEEENPHVDSSGSRNQEGNDPIFSVPQRCVAVKRDLLLLENQLPFFVLEDLFSLTLGRISDLPKLPDLVLKYFREMLRIGDKPSNSKATKNCCWPSDCILSLDPLSSSSGKKKKDPPSPRKYHHDHILHLLRDHYAPNPPEPGKMERIPSASDLDYAGVKFVARTEREGLFNIEFNPSTPRPLFSYCCRARFEIPSLCVDDSTEPFLRNLIAFERCCPHVPGYFTSYAVLMDTLINTEKDVEVLEKAKVISNHLGTRGNASRLFNNLCKEVPVDRKKGFHFVKACEDAHKYSQNSWCSRAIPATTAYVIRKYSAGPWTFKAFVIAFIAFVISVTNFIRSFVG